MEQLRFTEGLDVLIQRIGLRSRDDVTLVGVAGGSASGKTYLARELVKRVRGARLLSMDNYYKGKQDMPDPNNYDHPDCLELDLLARHLQLFGRGWPVDIPRYDFATSSRVGTQRISAAPVFCVEGLYALHPTVKDLLDFKVFVEAPEQSRLQRRTLRDIAEGRRMIGDDGVEGVERRIARYWDLTVEPMYRQFIEPTKAHADIVITNG